MRNDAGINGTLTPKEVVVVFDFEEVEVTKEKTLKDAPPLTRQGLRPISVNLFWVSRKTFVLVIYARVVVPRGLSQCFANY